MNNTYNYHIPLVDNYTHGNINFSNPEYKIQNDLRDSSTSTKRIVVYQGKLIIPVNIEDVLVVFTDNNSKFIQTCDQQYICSYPLEKLEQMFDSHFFRINRQYLICYNSIDQIFFEDSTRLCIRLKKPLDVALQVSRRKMNSFLQWLERG